ncbi:hypothetical protein KZY66_07610 [Prevotella salivae]|mgnify:CR=1 FL=1|jgi:hypothetical protein|uniref:Uncharacterized protein n=1 Tax=Myoviridae sp. ctLEM34 TaxID=2825082 RepID=A0A8S5TR28_9CAUD|nr:hypothetical protein [Segatella salivae]MBF1547918.1 hypothetical protein [Segatella salivae]MBW4907150.1 hypothetical protein [Segatella salivae]DAF84653.1 MAG TPA: Protein of unknown function (DUF1018) [Myoviridae sp. ctLEM34]
MANERNYARFYTLLKKMPAADKKTLVSQYTDGRTTSLRETTQQEYNKMCRDMEQVAGYDERMSDIRRELRRKRSMCLKLMQQLGIDTTDWDRVNAFCEDTRIAGKAFRHISIDELEALAVKLRAIKRKKEASPSPSESMGTIVMLSVNHSTEN